MAWWRRWLSDTEQTPAPQADSPGDPEGAIFEQGEEIAVRSLPMPMPSQWNGWPSEWETAWGSTSSGLTKLIDTAWACINLNSSVLSSMPVYRLVSGEIAPPRTWMINPDPMIYTSWVEFAKQMFWDYQCCGEVFIMAMTWGSDGYPATMRVMPPWMVNVEIGGGGRQYNIGRKDVTSDMLHIRYQSNTADAHGHGPLEVAGARMTTAGLLQRYAAKLAETGITPPYWIGIDKWLNKTDAAELLDIWVDERKSRPGEPALLSGGAGLHQMMSMNAKDMALVELQQFNASAIAVLLGVPPFLVGLPGPGGLTYSNETQLFDFHDRSSLRPEAQMVMSALSYWALPSTQCVELNRDEYSRPDFGARADAWAKLLAAGAVSVDEVRLWERFTGPAPGAVAGNYTATEQVSPMDTGNQAAVSGGNGNAVQGG